MMWLGRNPLVLILLAAVVVTVGIEIWGRTQPDPLVIHPALFTLLLAAPFIAAVTLVSRRASPRPRVWRRGVTWLVAMMLSWVTVMGVHMAAARFVPVDLSRAATYNFSHFGYVHYAMAHRSVKAGEAFPAAARAGDPIARGTVRGLDGNAVPLSASWRQRPLVLEIGSITCPVFIGNIPRMRELAEKYRGRAEFAILYTREAHPGEFYPAHASLAQKLSHAWQLKRLENVARPILVDRLNGDLHRRLGPRPNSVFVVGTDGVIAYRADWNDPEQTEEALQATFEQGGVGRGPVKDLEDNFIDVDTELIVETIEVLGRSGFSAVADFVISLPQMWLARAG